MSEVPLSASPEQPTRSADAPDIAEREAALREALTEEEERRDQHRKSSRLATRISICAAIVSILSAGASYYRAQQEETHTRRQDLTALISRMVALQEDQTDEYVMLGHLAPSLIDKVGGDISGPEYAIAARAVEASGDMARALDYSNRATRKAEAAHNVIDLAWALRRSAWTLMLLQKFEDADAHYQRAIRESESAPVPNMPSMKADKAFTFSEWAVASAMSGRCEQAKARVEQGRKLLREIVAINDIRAIQPRIEAADAYIAICNPGSATPPPSDAKSVGTAGTR